MNVQGKNMLITGASRGIGRALALHFAGHGARLFLAARTEAGLHETRAAIEAAGGTASCHPSDLCVPESLERLAEAVQAQGGIDILINDAADLTSKPLLESSLDDIDVLVRTNLVGLLQLTRLLAPAMMARGGGMIVNLSSLSGYKPNPAQTVYSISKGAVNAASEALRAELAGKGIRVMNVALPSIAVGRPAARGQVAVEVLAQRLERAIAAETAELFLSPVSKWLMRAYRFCPALMRLER